MARNDIRSGGAFVELYVKRSKFNKALADAQQRLTSFGSSIIRIGGAVTAAGTAIIGTVVASVTGFAKVGDQLDKLSKRTGASVKFLAEMGFAAEQAGQDMQAIEKGLIGVQKLVGDAGRGLATATDGMDALGMSVEDFAGKNAEQQFEMVIGSLENIESATERNQAAMLIFGKRAGPAMASIADGLTDARKEAGDLGLVPDQQAIDAAARITDAINRVKRVAEAAWFEIGAAFAPVAEDILANFLKVASAGRKWITENKTLIITVAKVAAVTMAAGASIMAIGGSVVAAGLALKLVLASMAGFASAVGLIGSVMGAVSATIGLVLSPVGLLAVALGAAAAAWLAFTEGGKSARESIGGGMASAVGAVSQAFAKLKDIAGSVWDAIAAGDMAMAGEIAMTALKLVMFKGIDAISSYIGDVFGDTAAKFLTQIMGGDFAGAWNTVVLEMQNVWASFTGGIIKAFSAAGKVVVENWKNTVDELTNYILQQASKGGAFGAFFERISGVDVGAEMARSAELDAQMRERGMNPGQSIADQIRNGTYEDPATAATAESMNRFFDTMAEDADRKSENAARASVNNSAGAGAAASAEVTRLSQELADLQRRAAMVRAAAGQNGPGGAGFGVGSGTAEGGAGGGLGASKAVGGFNAASVIAQLNGSGSTPQVKAINEVKKAVNEVTERLMIDNAMLIDAFKNPPDAFV